MIEAKDETPKPKRLEDFQHEEIVGPTVERDLSPVADELRESLGILQKRIESFQETLLLLGCVQGVGAVWCYVSWQALNPTWQLLPSALLSFTLAFVLRQALQPIAFFGKLEQRSRLRIVTLSLMIAKGFASFFNRARISVAASAVGLICVLLYIPSTYLLGLLGILKWKPVQGFKFNTKKQGYVFSLVWWADRCWSCWRRILQQAQVQAEPRTLAPQAFSIHCNNHRL